MPLFDYQCASCGHAFEALVFHGDEPECPHCKGKELARQLSLPAAPAAGAGPQTCRSQGPPCGPVCGRWKGTE